MYVEESKMMKGRQFSFSFTREKGTKSLVEFFTSSRPFAHLTTWILICKWNLNFVGNFALGNLPWAAFVFGSFQDQLQLYGLFSQPDSFRALFFPFIPIPFFHDLFAFFPLSSVSSSSIYAPFSPVSQELSRKMPDREEELAAWNSRTDWILIIPAFLSRVFHVPRFFFPFLYRFRRIASSFVMRYRILQKRRILGKGRK